MADWTTEQIAERLEEAADVLARLPETRVQGYFTAWPDVVHSFADQVGQLPVTMNRPRPSPAAITRMEEALEWLRLLEADDALLLWDRAGRTPWKATCWRFGISRATANRRWQYGLTVIALKLSGKRVFRSNRRRTTMEKVKFVW